MGRREEGTQIDKLGEQLQNANGSTYESRDSDSNATVARAQQSRKQDTPSRSRDEGMQIVASNEQS
jgi:hypothetical protein